ncbi:MAG: hypothetical protein ACT4PS_06115 [Betaproteobacteria bacterium]
MTTPAKVFRNAELMVFDPPVFAEVGPAGMPVNRKKVNLSLYLLNIINGDIKANYARIITDFLGKANQVVAKMKHF